MTAEPCTSFRSRGSGVGVLTCRCLPSRTGGPAVFKHFHRLPVSSYGEDARPCLRFRLRFLRWLRSPSAVGTSRCKAAGKAREATVQGGKQEDPKRCPPLPLHVGRPPGAGCKKATVLEQDRKGRGLPQRIPSSGGQASLLWAADQCLTVVKGGVGREMDWQSSVGG